MEVYEVKKTKEIMGTLIEEFSIELFANKDKAINYKRQLEKHDKGKGAKYEIICRKVIE